MPRPARRTDQKLILAAIALLPQTGFSGLNLRRVAARAGVNVGLFPYYFRNKRAFLQRVMQELYEEFYRGLSLEASTGEGAQAQLRMALIGLGRFVREQRRLILALGRDLMDGNTEVLRFLEANFHRHIGLLLRLVRACQSEGTLRRLPPQTVMPLLFAAPLAPSLIAALLERLHLSPAYEVMKRVLLPSVLTDQALTLRVDLALRTLAPDPAPPPRTTRRRRI